MNASEAENVAATLFDRFARAFGTFDAANVVELFAVPSVALRNDGSKGALSTREDVLHYYQAALDGYTAAVVVGRVGGWTSK